MNFCIFNVATYQLSCPNRKLYISNFLYIQSVTNKRNAFMMAGISLRADSFSVLQKEIRLHLTPGNAFCVCLDVIIKRTSYIVVYLFFLFCFQEIQHNHLKIGRCFQLKLPATIRSTACTRLQASGKCLAMKRKLSLGKLHQSNTDTDLIQS